MKKGKTKKWMILLGILIILIVPLNKASARSLAPVTLQYYKPNGTDTWSRSPVSGGNLYGETYYHTSVSTINDISGIYGISNNQISGSIVSFTMMTNSAKPTITAQVQVLDSSFINCEIVTAVENYATGTYYTAKCSLGNSQQIYKYGFNWRDDQGYGYNENGYYISKVNVFDSEGEYNSYFNTLNTSMQQIHSDNQQLQQNLATRWAQEQQNWNNFENADISNGTKQQPNQDQFNNLQNEEQDVYDNLDDIDIEALIDMNVDTQTNNWIWNTMTTLLNTNIRVLGMVISILSLGLCKFILGR